MKASEFFIPTLRDVPAEAELISHQLLLRAGYIRKLGAGVYTYLPLAWRIIRKIEKLLQTEMEAIGCGEMRMPTLQQKEILLETGRWDVDVVYKLRDRREAEFALGFTHEEVMADIARRDMRSWRDLPRLLYQIQTKFRDEPRPRGGLIRTREFIMFDAYSFDRDEAGMTASYQKMWQAYVNTFRKMDLPFLVVEADGGAIGDLDNHEFMTLADAGEDTVLRCPACGYAANAERCAVVLPPAGVDAQPGGDKPLEIVSTPGARTIAEVADMLGAAHAHLVKTLLFVADGVPVAALVRGDREINEIKLRRFLQAKQLELADEKTVERVTTAPVGFAGPVGINGVRIVADHEIARMHNFITGANQSDAHFVHVNIGRDFTPTDYADVRVAVADDVCPNCADAVLEEARGIEVGHIFKLGDKYSGAMGADFANETGGQSPILMGSYGIGLGRTMAAVLEKSHDENGIIWPVALAPFVVVIVIANIRDQAAMQAGQELHDALSARGIDVMLDDRDERAGVKFKDADLVGYPVRVVIGKGLANGVLELRARRDAQSGREVPVENAADTIAQLIAEMTPA